MDKHLQKHTLHLRAGDIDYIKALVPEGKASELVRKLVSRFVDSTKTKDEQVPIADLTDLQL